MPFFNSKKPVNATAGFTIMEIVVATTIFAILVVGLTALFNYVLKINRRSEALRQASQDMRNFVEGLVKEVRNGQVDYFVINGTSKDAALGPCQPPAVVGNSTYSTPDNRLAIFNTDNVQECFYYGKADGSTYVDTIGSIPSTFSAPAGSNYTLVLQKQGIAGTQNLNPPNLSLDDMSFLINPTKDPYTAAGGGIPKVQPSVVILMKFTVRLPTGEQVPIYYQTAVSENKYDIPNTP